MFVCVVSLSQPSSRDLVMLNVCVCCLIVSAQLLIRDVKCVCVLSRCLSPVVEISINVKCLCVLSRCLSPVVEIRDVKCLCVLSRCLSPVVEIRDVKCLCVLSRCLRPVVEIC